MYSSGLPIVLIVTWLNFIIIYWVDKWFLIKFYRTPKNFDEQSIIFTLDQMKYGFIFHFFVGLIVFSNDRILSSSDTKEEFRKEDDSFFRWERYQKFNVILFIVGNLFLIAIQFLKSFLLNFLVSNFEFLDDLQSDYEDANAVSDDYYN